MNLNPSEKLSIFSTMPGCQAWAERFLGCIIVALGLLTVSSPAQTLSGSLLTKVRDVRRLAQSDQSVPCFVSLEGVVLWINPARDQFVLQDDSGGMQIEMDLRDQPSLQAGQHVLLQGRGLLGAGAFKEELINNDGLHQGIEKSETINLEAGGHPIRIDWFNAQDRFELDVAFKGPGLPRQKIPDSALFRAQQNSAGGTSNWVHGLDYRCYEGSWERLPNFQKLNVNKTGTASNFDLSVRTRDVNVGLQFTGFLEVPQAGLYTFWIKSDDGSRFFIDEPPLHLTVIAAPEFPRPLRILPGQALTEEQDCQWVVVEGTISFVGQRSDAGNLEMELSSGTGSMHLEVAGGTGGASQFFLNSRVRVTGISKSTFNTEGQRVAGALFVPGLKQIEFLEPAAVHWTDCPVLPISHLARSRFREPLDTLVHVRGKVRSFKPGESLQLEDETGQIKIETTQPAPSGIGIEVEALGRWTLTGTNAVLQCGFYREMPRLAQQATNALPLLTAIEQVKSLSREEIQRGYPVKTRGIVTALLDSGFFLQDALSSVYVRDQGLTLPDTLRAGDYWEVEGVTFAEFAPSIRAQRAFRLGPGTLPEPLYPTWDQMMNGSLDTRYVEIQGVVITASPDGMELLTRAGKVKVKSDIDSAICKKYENALIRIRGCVIPAREEDSLHVQSGYFWLNNASVNVDQPAPVDPFAAPLEHASDLLLFDARASALKRVKIDGLILREQAGQFFLWEGLNGMRFIPRTPVKLEVGDTVEVVGFPDLGGPSPILREALVRRTGHTHLPPAQTLSGETLLSRRHDATMVRIQARLTEVITDHSGQVLSMQAGTRGFVARLDGRQGLRPDLLPGSRLELVGVYAGQGGDLTSGPDISSFELLLNSPSDIKVLESPDWWTLRRLLAALGIIAVVLVGAMLWVLTLKRQVSAQSIVIHQKVQREATLEERARIAREIHDTLEQALAGTSLQLDALASTLQNVPQRPRSILEMARSMVRHAQEEARRTVRNLRLLALENHDLPNALSQLASKSVDGISAEIQVSITGSPMALASQVENHLLRIGQEATTNAIKHSSARLIRLELEYAAAGMRLTVRDDGCGFDAAHAAPTEAGHFGLLGMRERAEKIGGTLQILSNPGRGTVIQVNVPLTQPAPGQPPFKKI